MPVFKITRPHDRIARTTQARIDRGVREEKKEQARKKRAIERRRHTKRTINRMAMDIR